MPYLDEANPPPITKKDAKKFLKMIDMAAVGLKRRQRLQEDRNRKMPFCLHCTVFD